MFRFLWSFVCSVYLVDNMEPPLDIPSDLWPSWAPDSLALALHVRITKLHCTLSLCTLYRLGLQLRWVTLAINGHVIT